VWRRALPKAPRHIGDLDRAGPCQHGGQDGARADGTAARPPCGVNMYPPDGGSRPLFLRPAASRARPKRFGMIAAPVARVNRLLLISLITRLRPSSTTVFAPLRRATDPRSTTHTPHHLQLPAGAVGRGREHRAEVAARPQPAANVWRSAAGRGPRVGAAAARRHGPPRTRPPAPAAPAPQRLKEPRGQPRAPAETPLGPRPPRRPRAPPPPSIPSPSVMGGESAGAPAPRAPRRGQRPPGTPAARGRRKSRGRGPSGGDARCPAAGQQARQRFSHGAVVDVVEG
jgi:hypothetical protein